MENALKREGIDAVFQYPIRGGRILDFAITDLKIDIECDGEAWHKSKQKDKIRDIFLGKKGWIILRFKGNDIKNNIEECIEKVWIVVNNERDKNRIKC